MITLFLLASFFASIELRTIRSFHIKRPEIQKCSSLILSKFVKMLYIIINSENENFSSISIVSIVLYEIRPIESWYPIAAINVCSFLAIFEQTFLQF